MKTSEFDLEERTAIFGEEKELHLIFVAIIRTTDRNLRATQLPKSPSPSGISH